MLLRISFIYAFSHKKDLTGKKGDCTTAALSGFWITLLTVLALWSPFNINSSARSVTKAVRSYYGVGWENLT